MPTKLLAKPVYIQVIIFKKHVSDALDKGKRDSGIDTTTTYIKHLIVRAAKSN